MRAHVRRRSCGASFSIPARLAASFTTSHSTFGVMPSPHTLPDLLIERNTVPLVIPAAVLQTVNRGLDPLWDRNRPDMSRLALQVRDHPMLFPNLERIHRQR